VDGLDFDMLAASLRADAADGDTFFEVLAGKLSGALGERVQLRREGGMFKKARRVEAVTVDFAPSGPVFEATKSAKGFECRVRRAVRGIVVSNTEVSLAEWLDSLVQNLAEEAKRSEQARNALEGLIT
jgi:hypothetical protein